MNAEGIGTILKIELSSEKFLVFSSSFYLIEATILTVKTVGAFVVPAIAPAPERIWEEKYVKQALNKLQTSKLLICNSLTSDVTENISPLDTSSWKSVCATWTETENKRCSETLAPGKTATLTVS